MLSPSPVRSKFVWTRVRSAAGGRMLALLAAAVVVLHARPASAQIYSWRDANGSLVLSNVRPASTIDVVSYSVPKAESVRATRYAAVDRGRLYDDLIVEHAQRNNVRADLVRAVVQVESAFNPRARSIKGAMGLMQLMPATMRQYNVVDAYDPSENVRAGVAYLRELLDRYEGNEELALAAYNAGPGAVDKHGQTVPPYRETKNYVSAIGKMAGRPVEVRSGQIYKVFELVDGQPTVRYTDRKPTSGTYEVVGRR